MNGLGIKGSETLSEALKVNTKLLHLNVSSNRIPPEGAGCIAVALKSNETLSSLNVSVFYTPN